MPQRMRLRFALLPVVLCSLLPAAAAHAATVPGVNVAGAPGPTSTSLVLASGAKYVRYFLHWQDAEPTKGALSPAFISGYQAGLAPLVAAGVKVDLVVTGAPPWANGGAGGNTPPTDPADMASFMGLLATALKGKIAAYEIWNEPDNGEFWNAPIDPVRYTALVKAVYPAVKAADPTAIVLAGPFSGNDYDFLQAMYQAGAKGSFDGVAVHTDNACLNTGPGIYYRDGTRIGRYSFLGYREIHNTIVQNGDTVPIWMTELGWSSTATQCARGDSAGKKTAGVSEANQALYLQQAYHCMDSDSDVAVAEWFTLSDAGAADTEMNRYGLIRSNGTFKPSYNAFRALATKGDQQTGACGDFSGPKITVNQPTAGTKYADHLVLSATASDSDGLHRISFLCDGKKISTFGVGLGTSHTSTMTWYGSANIPLGPHTIEVQSTDAFGNLSEVDVPIVHVLASQLPQARTWVTASVKGSGLIRTVTGQVHTTGPGPVRGRVHVVFQVLTGTKWLTRHTKGANASKPFKIVQHLAKAGRWRVRVTYTGKAPFKTSSSPSHSFLARG
jgi:polysaccharide biosynthesis protein PslG